MFDIINNSRIFSAVYHVWNGLRTAGEIVPTRDHFNPMALAGTLPEMVLVERVEKGRYEYRVVGTAISERLHANPVGFNMRDFFAPSVRDFITDWFEAVTFHPCGVITRADMVFERADDRSVHAFGLPLLGKGGEGHYYLFAHEAWQPRSDENLGQILSVGEFYIESHPVDIGAGRPLLPNMPTRRT